MRTIAISLLCLLIAAIFAGCVPQTDTGDTSMGGVSSLPESTAGESTAATNPSVSVHAAGSAEDFITAPVSLQSLEEYNEFISRLDESTLPLTYADFAFMGEFRDALFYRAEIGDYVSCYYTLMDANGFEFNFSIAYDEPSPVENTLQPLDGLLDPLDLRRVPDYQTGYFEYRNTYYKYSLGDLTFIRWRANGLSFSLWPEGTAAYPDEFPAYPKDGEQTFIMGLLNLYTIEDTLAQMGAFVEDPIAPK